MPTLNSKTVKIKISIGLNEGFVRAIYDLLVTVNNENERCSRRTLSPGEEIQKAFGINIPMIVKESIKEIINEQSV